MEAISIWEDEKILEMGGSNDVVLLKVIEAQ